MGSFGSFYKGEKKKPKNKNKNNNSANLNTQGGGPPAPTFTMPEVISKKRPGE